MKEERPDLFVWAMAVVLLIILSLLFTGGCNMAKGFGQMVEGAGQDIKMAAENYVE